MRGWRWPADSRRYSVLLGAVLLFLLAVSGMLTWEAWVTSRSHRAAAEDALHDYAMFAAMSFTEGATGRLIHGSKAILSAVGAMNMSLEQDRVYDPAVLVASASAAKACDCVWAAEPDYVFSYRPRDSALAVVGVRPPDPLERRRLIDSLARNFDTMLVHPERVERRGQDYVVLDTVHGAPQLLLMTLQIGRHAVPSMVYGFSTPLQHYTRAVLPSLMASPLLPKPVTRGTPNDSLFAVTVRGARGELLYRSAGATDDSTYAVTLPLWRFDPEAAQARVALRPGAAEKLLAGGVPRTRVPLLGALLVMAGALALVALALMQRSQELARLRADFTSSVSHELRTPLAQILLFAEMMHLGRAEGDRERSNAVRVILRESRRLAHLVDNVLLFSRTEHRALRLSPQAQALAPIVEDTVELFAPLARTRNVTVRVTVDERLIAPVDPDALEQILLNLLENALKYGPEGQTVNVGLALDGGDARIWVDDQGPGVPREARESVWEPFVRLPRAGGSASTGSGIGLAVVRQLVTMHGGRCWVGTAERGGARFAIELPGARMLTAEHAIVARDHAAGTGRAPAPELVGD